MPRGGPRFASRKLSTWSRRPLQAIDARTLEARRERLIVAELTAHLGGHPNFPQQILIARASRLLVVIELMERHMIEGGEVAQFPGNQLLAWVNTLRRTLDALGMKRLEGGPKRLADVLKIKAA